MLPLLEFRRVLFRSNDTAYRCYRDWSSDVCSSDLAAHGGTARSRFPRRGLAPAEEAVEHPDVPHGLHDIVNAHDVRALQDGEARRREGRLEPPRVPLRVDRRQEGL